MTFELKPETERLVREEIKSGRFRTIDELIVRGVDALREKSEGSQVMDAPCKHRKNLAQFLMESPFAGSELDLGRQKDYGRTVEL